MRTDEKREQRLAASRQALEAHLRGVVPDNEWAFLVAERYVDEQITGQKTVAELAEDVRRHRAAWRSRASRRGAQKSITPPPIGRTADIAQLDAARLTYAYPIDDFRADHLRDLLASGEPVYEWIEDQSQREKHRTQWLKVKLPPRHAWESLPGSQGYGIVPKPPIVIGKGKASADELIELTMLVPDRDGPTEIRIAEGGVLDALHRLASRIALDVGWTEAEAVEFILTGEPPHVPLVDAEIRGGSRITLSIHPSVTPRELAAAYSALRRDRGLTARNLTAKHTALAAFDERESSGETWAVRMKAWNASLPKEHKDDWRYTRVTNFARDAKKARERMEERSGTTRER